MEKISAAQLITLWLFVPAVLGWLGFGLALLLAPHLTAQPDPLIWSAYAAGGWWALMVICFGGWIGLLILASA